jgi:phosphomannomutase/phosphomannomutase/phosphoglucomutase
MPLTIVTNAGNGCAGPVIDALEPELPFKFIKLQHGPDGRFPNGIPNPLLPENRAVSADAVREHNADMGIAWDGDFDRCFFFDGDGGFVEGYYLVGLLARTLLADNKGAKIVHDPRLTWSTIETVKAAGGVPILSKTGHAFIKERMRREDALYGGEMSAHHYFRDFRYCDSGMIPWLLVAELISVTGQSLKQLVAAQQAAFPVSGEINRAVADPDRVIAAVEKRYLPKATHMDQVDGLSLEYPDWRFNLRKSNTEPILRLNVESRGNAALMQTRTAELLGLIDSVGVPAKAVQA